MFFFYLDRLTHDGAIDPLRTALAAAREVVPDISVATLTTFLDLAAQARDEPITTKEVSNACSIPYARLMRHIEVLGEGSRRSPGHGLLKKAMNTVDRRPEIKVSPKGRELLAAMAAPLRAD
jgi:DNA-binding MarR family transcriptional regulator